MCKIKVGQRVRIGGGYSGDEWLGSSSGEGIVVCFQKVPSKEVPVLFIELDERVVAYGGKYSGKFAAVKPRYTHEDWNTPKLTVQVFLMDEIPEDTLWFQNRRKIEVETHAAFDPL